MKKYKNEWDVYLRNVNSDDELVVRVEGGDPEIMGGLYLRFSLGPKVTGLFPNINIEKVVRVEEEDELTFKSADGSILLCSDGISAQSSDLEGTACVSDKCGCR